MRSLLALALLTFFSLNSFADELQASSGASSEQTVTATQNASEGHSAPSATQLTDAPAVQAAKSKIPDAIVTPPPVSSTAGVPVWIYATIAAFLLVAGFFTYGFYARSNRIALKNLPLSPNQRNCGYVGKKPFYSVSESSLASMLGAVLGPILFFLGIVLTPVLIGLPLLLIGAFVMQSRADYRRGVVWDTDKQVVEFKGKFTWLPLFQSGRVVIPVKDIRDIKRWQKSHVSASGDSYRKDYLHQLNVITSTM